MRRKLRGKEGNFLRIVREMYFLWAVLGILVGAAEDCCVMHFHSTDGVVNF